VLLDAHPFLDDPLNVRLMRQIAAGYARTPRTLVLVSPKLELAPELARACARFALQMPDARAMTANDIESLPPELVRKGRLDEIFFVDLPDDPARQEIFAIHLRKRRLDAKRFDLAALAGAADGFSGAEIEQAIVAALYESMASGSPVDTSLILAEIARTRPLSVTMAERIARLRAWAVERTALAD